MRATRSGPERFVLVAGAGAVGGAVAGAVLGVVVEDLAEGEAGLPVLAAMAAMVTDLILIAVIAVQARQSEEHRNASESSTRQLLGTVQEGTRELRESFDVLERRIGQKIQYQFIDSLNAEIESIQDDPVTRAVVEAKREILVLDILDDKGRRPTISMKEPLITEFLATLLGKVVAGSDVKYHRVCQVSDPSAEEIPTQSEYYLEHCLEMCRHRAEGKRHILLQATQVRYPFKFILVDRRILMLQLNRLDRGQEQRRDAWYELIFIDVDQQLLGAFLDMWEDVVHDPTTHTLERPDMRFTGNDAA